jgi:tRNA A37 N6-isopentenylltransferase MiaA
VGLAAHEEKNHVRYDQKSDPYRYLNDPRLLDDTPIGTLRVITWAGVASVCVMHPTDNNRVHRIVHTMRHGDNPLDAIYGRRTHESRTVAEFYERRNEARAASEAREEAAVSHEHVKELEKIRTRYEDGEEAIVGALGLR